MENILSKYKNENIMEMGIFYTVDSDTIIAKIRLNDKKGSLIKIIRSPEGGGVKRGTIAFVDFESSTMGFYEAIEYIKDDAVVSYSKKISFDIKDNCEYLLEAVHLNFTQIIKITNLVTNETDEYSVTGKNSTDTGMGWGYRSFETRGELSVISFTNYCLEPYDCKLLIVGDSFVEGAAIYGQAEKRYCSMLKKELNGSVFIDGMGGAKLSNCRKRYNSYLKNICKPEYVMVAAGTNDYDLKSYIENLNAFISEIKDNGSIPILLTITPRNDISITYECMKGANDYLRNVLSKDYIIVDLNAVLTENSDGETLIEKMVNPDKVHPTPETHALMFEKIKTDWLEKI